MFWNRVFSMGTSFLQVGRFATSQESRFQGAKGCNIGRVYSKKVDFLISGISHTGCETFWNRQSSPARGIFADTQESRFNVKNGQIWAVSIWKYFDLQMLRKRVFRLWNVKICVLQSCNVVEFLLLRNRGFRVRNIEIWALLYSKKVDFLMSGISYIGCETFWNRQSSPARGFICWCSGIAYSGCETFRYVQCRHESTSICRCSGIAFSSLETFIYGQCWLYE